MATEYSTQTAKLTSNEDKYLLESEAGARVRVAVADYTATASIATGTLVVMHAIDRDLKLLRARAYSDTASLTVKAGYVLQSTLAGGDDDIIGATGSDISTATTAGLEFPVPVEGIEIPAGSYIVLTTEAAEPQSGDVIKSTIEYIEV